jgi:arsenate reductase (thioredoxin)
MAEAFLKQLGIGKFEAESGGIEKGKLNPFVIRAMLEVGIDISQNDTQEVFDLFRQGKSYQAVITVCEQEAAERCPIFPGRVKRIAWSFPDPSKFTGTDEEILAKVRLVRDEIKEKVTEFIAEAKDLNYWIRESIYEGSKR